MSKQFAIAVAFLLAAAVSFHAAEVTQTHKRYRVTVKSIERVQYWEEQNMRYTARDGGTVLLLHLTVASPDGSARLSDFRLEDTTGKSYNSNKTYGSAFAREKEKPMTATFTIPFIMPASARAKTFILGGETKFDIEALDRDRGPKKL